MYTYTYMYVHRYIYMYIYVLHILIYIYIYIHFTYICICICICIYIYIRVRIYIYEYIYTYMHIHIYIHICRPPDGSTKFPRKHPTNSTPLIDFGINYLEEPHLLPKRALLKTNRAPYFDKRAFYQLPYTLTSLFFSPFVCAVLLIWYT